MSELISTFGNNYQAFVLAVMGCTAVELLVRGEAQGMMSRVRAAAFWAVYFAVTTIVLVATMRFARHVGLEPVLALDLRNTTQSPDWTVAVAGYVLLPFATNILFDFFYYWFHRLQHAMPFLWRFHSVHHSIEELNAANCYHHVTESIFRVPFIILPTTLLIELQVPHVLVLSSVLGAWGYFVHANTPISLGPLGYLIASPRFHRVHHSLAGHHMDKNFASFYPFYDVIFGTAYFPDASETIRTGLRDVREPATVFEYVVVPFRGLFSQAREAAARPEAALRTDGRQLSLSAKDSLPD